MQTEQVRVMPRVQAWQCPHTKKLFPIEEKVGYKRHLAKLAKERAKVRKETDLRNSYAAWLAESTAELKTPTEIAVWARTNFRKIFEHHFRCKMNKGTKMGLIEMGGVYQESASNTHSAPRGMETNWGGHKTEQGVPRGYPGVCGKIKIHKHNVKFSSDSFRDTTGALRSVGICTGSGSGGDIGFYEVTLWLADWPGMAAEIDRQREAQKEQAVINRLKGHPVREFRVRWPDNNDIPVRRND
jgi:hypothetical protein